MNDHEEAIKFMIKSRLSYIHTNIERNPVRNIAESLGHLVSDLNAILNGLPQGK